MKLAALVLLAACSSAAPQVATTPPPPKPAAFTPTAFSVKVSGQGRPVIFIPGLASPGSVWDGTVAHLGGKVQAHVLTLAGFAGQPPIAQPFLQQVHDQIVQYIDANHLDHPIIVGHSLGGVMSLWLAETDPAIGGVVDVDGLPFFAAIMDPSVTSEKAKQMGDAMRQQLVASPREQFDGYMRQFLGGMVTSPENQKMLGDAAAKSDQTTIGNAFAEMIALDLRPDLGKITVPVLIVAATETHGQPRDQFEAAWHTQIDPIPHHDLQFVEGAKHFVMLDQPDKFYALVDTAVK